MNEKRVRSSQSPKSRRERISRQGALKSDINVKVDELFIRWFNLPGTQKSLKEGLREIRKQSSKKDVEANSVSKQADLQEANTHKNAPDVVQQNGDAHASPPPATSSSVKPMLSPRRKVASKGKIQSKIPNNSAASPTGVKTDDKPNNNNNDDVTIPRFYFPSGRPRSKDEIKNTLTKISKAFSKLGKDRLSRSELGPVAVACGYNEYWRAAIFKAAAKPDDDTVSKSDVISMWSRLAQSNHDAASRFVKMLAKPGAGWLEFDDLLCLMQDVVERHPGLSFLREAPEFHSRYMNTVIARIFYVVNRSWSGKITVAEMRKSNFLQVLGSLEEEQDINSVPDYFSYEHFYVVYCKFWELDTDHDLVIDRRDLARHANGALSGRLIERVLSGAVTRWDTSDHRDRKMSYVDFVWFLISEEDKKSSTSIEYWFRCMDLDGDGVISMYEMEHFYEEQMSKLEQLDIEPLPFHDCVCQMLDMVKPLRRDRVTLSDLKSCKMADVFYDTFFNVEKYLDHEQKDPFAPQKDAEPSANEPSDWEKFAADEYEILVAEEQANERGSSFDMHYDDDVDPLIEEELRRLALGGAREAGSDEATNLLDEAERGVQAT